MGLSVPLSDVGFIVISLICVQAADGYTETTGRIIASIGLQIIPFYQVIFRRAEQEARFVYRPRRSGEGALQGCPCRTDIRCVTGNYRRCSCGLITPGASAGPPSPSPYDLDIIQAYGPSFSWRMFENQSKRTASRRDVLA